jgi:hypothetical protein
MIGRYNNITWTIVLLVKNLNDSLKKLLRKEADTPPDALEEAPP